MKAPYQLPAHLKADCSACVALCCVIPPFDAVQGFGFDKPAETPCQHLCGDHRCGIHDALIERSFAGCVAFDCLGAGQRLTSLAVERFGSADWRARPEVARWLFAAYPRMRQAQEWLARLSLAAAATGSADLQAVVAELEAESAQWPDWSADVRAGWQARVQAALAPLAENRGSMR
ncbi:MULTISPECIES: hypothetical protein [unclassified Roseateles]|uniref:hypothetical protein n=1 Tax=unclassified Roseateles TaxID=2626991 RepID=UPI000701EFBF|nr:MULTISPECIES: hypothetical protein [unclassified Roseateles]KQW52266.1 hypothetical protein ASC81_06705 [Pelomonas sp. Root405]KRA78500.1 hypothetical protein ASD88_06710 [Pelomonas sp. Root662]